MESEKVQLPVPGRASDVKPRSKPAGPLAHHWLRVPWASDDPVAGRPVLASWGRTDRLAALMCQIPSNVFAALTPVHFTSSSHDGRLSSHASRVSRSRCDLTACPAPRPPQKLDPVSL